MPLLAELTPVAGVDPWVYVILGLMTMISSIVVGYFAWDGRRHAREANDAVNQRHKLGVDEKGNPVKPRIYDAVLQINEDMSHVKERVDKVELQHERQSESMKRMNTHLFLNSDHITELQGEIRTLGHELTSHVKWEEAHKYKDLSEMFDVKFQLLRSELVKSLEKSNDPNPHTEGDNK